MSVTMTGARGFLGWHTRAALRETGIDVTDQRVGDAFNLTTGFANSDRFIHIAGVNRGTDTEVRDGNLLFARQAAEAIRRADRAPRVVTFANSIQASNGSVYGDAKLEAADILGSAAAAVGAEFVDLRLPHLFGEHGRPFYNAVTSTFAHMLANGETPQIENDKPLSLLHAQDAAELLIGSATPSSALELAVEESVSGMLRRLSEFASTYSRGEIPNISSRFDRDLFNTYRSYTFPKQAPIALSRQADARGSFFEVIRTHGGTGQSSFSTTAPGIIRGDHFHRRKIERFTVLSGRAVIRLRKLFDDQVFSFEVDGGTPVAVDMPTMWTHSIQNTGDDVLYTSFWTNDIFDSKAPDTIAEVVVR